MTIDEGKLQSWFDRDPDRQISSKRQIVNGKNIWLSFVFRPDLNRYIGASGETRAESEENALIRALKTKE